MKIIFHGDPHGGNIYIDSEGNVGFLDMGLIFELTDEDAFLTRDFFLTAYSCNYDKLVKMLTKYAVLSDKENDMFSSKVKEYTFDVRNKPVTSYFTDMINICLSVNIAPPNFLFCMAKAFICLDGISMFSENKTSAVNLLEGQTIEFFVDRCLVDCKNIVGSGISLAPKLISDSLRYGISKGITNETLEILKLRDNLRSALEHCEEIIGVMKN